MVWNTAARVTVNSEAHPTRTALFQTHRPRLIESVRRHQGKTKFVIGGQGAPEVDPELTELGVELWDARLEVEKLKGKLRL